ncbi:hypothetical protein ALC56_05279, partial [Trachymyrmex septentrionalis]
EEDQLTCTTKSVFVPGFYWAVAQCPMQSVIEFDTVTTESNKTRRNFRGDVLPKLFSAAIALAQHPHVSLVSELTFATNAMSSVKNKPRGFSLETRDT